MHIHTIETHKITRRDQNLFAILDTYVSVFDDRTVLAITSKIVSICEGRVVKIGTVDKRTLIAQEADVFLPAALNKYHTTLTMKQGILIPTAGIDESNGEGYYVLWPRDPQQTANAVRAYLQRRFSRKYVGVIITDSKTTPLRVGVTGVALAYSGFQALNDYVGTKDLFGRALRMTKVNVVDALATAAVLVMGEGSEQTPLAVVGELPFVTFQERDPSRAEVQQLRIAVEEDIYGPLLTSVQWHKGQR
jgi:dihydrofolate synthase / folylpolyglutamate synthase